MQYVGSVLSGLIFAIGCEKMQKDAIRCENSNVVFLMEAMRTCVNNIGSDSCENKCEDAAECYKDEDWWL
jgi:hypothetical protein